MMSPIVKLADIFDVARGGSPRPIEKFLTNSEDGVNWIMIGDTNLDSKYIQGTAKKIIPDGVRRSRFVKEGDFLLTNSMSFGHPYILKISGCIHDGWLVLSPKSEQICNDYFYYFLGSKTIRNKLAQEAKGAVVKNLNKEIVSKLQIPLPSLEEQKRIATILDKVDCIRRKRQESLKQADAFIKSVFLDMFGDPVTNPKGWKVTSLNMVSSLITKGASPKWQGYEYTNDSSQTLFVTSENVREGYLNLAKRKYLQDEFNLKQKRSILQERDLLINIVGASIGRAAQFLLPIKANINQAVALVRVDRSKINDVYLLYYLNSPKALAMYEAMQVSVARANLSLQNIADLEILIPPAQLQNEFASMMKQTNLMKLSLQNNLNETETLFKALQQDFFG